MEWMNYKRYKMQQNESKNIEIRSYETKLVEANHKD
jgi:hypothetical protein